MKKNIKFYVIIVLLLLIIGLTIFGVIYAIKNHNKTDILTIDNMNNKITINSNQLDSISQPITDAPLVYKELPKAKDTITEIDFKTFKKIFQTEGKSILILVKDRCNYCDQFIPTFENTLNYYNIKAYKIDISKISSNASIDMYNYIDYEGTPTTYIINNGKVKHVLSGSVDEDTLKAFIDYFYLRNN